jgi:hypothetical protein
MTRLCSHRGEDRLEVLVSDGASANRRQHVKAEVTPVCLGCRRQVANGGVDLVGIEAAM